MVIGALRRSGRLREGPGKSRRASLEGARRPFAQGSRWAGRRRHRPAAPRGLCPRARAHAKARAMKGAASRLARASARLEARLSRRDRGASSFSCSRAIGRWRAAIGGKGGEIDLIMRRGRAIAFVEVKARDALETALEAIGPASGASSAAPPRIGSRATPGPRPAICAPTRCSSRRAGCRAISLRCSSSRSGRETCRQGSAPPLR